MSVWAQGGSGANTPFTTIEAESGALAGGATAVSLTVTNPPPNVSSPAMEASGRAYVQLTATGQSVSWTNPVANATALNVRFCIPDGAAGGGTTATLDLYINGVFRQAVTMSSAQAWVYESNIAANGMSNTPGTGLYPHVFFDETHFFITGAPVASGSTIMLKRDAANTASFYYIDCVDVEAPPAPLAQPANSLSITSYGAVGDGVTDCTTAIKNCISAAQTAGKSVWIPSGTFVITAPISESGVTIAGAGMWYSEINKQPGSGGSDKISVWGGGIQDLFIDTNATTRSADYGIIASGGTGLLVQRVWLQHTGAAIWVAGTNGTVRDCRIANSWADGINLNNGNASVGNNLTATNNFVRGSGDDCIAIFSNNKYAGSTNMDQISVTNNTVVAPWWADGIRIAGGQDITVANNYIADSVTNRGLIVGIYGADGFPLVSSTVNNNTIVRCGGSAYLYALAIGGTSTQPVAANVHDNLILDSPYEAVHVGNETTLTFGPNNVIDTVGITGIEISSGSNGTGSFTSNIFDNIQSGQTAFINNAPTTFTATQQAEALQFEAESMTIPNYSGPDYRLLTDPLLNDGQGAILDSTAVGNYLTFLAPNIAAGTYDVKVRVKRINTRGIWQLAVGTAANFSGTKNNVGSPVDDYSAGQQFTTIDLGTWTPGTTSDKWFRFTITGKNASSTGYTECFDYIRLTPQ